MDTFTHTTLGATGMPVHRLGMSASYWPGERAIRTALDAGINYVFAYGIDRQMIRTMRDAFGTNRERYVLATGAYNYIFARQNLRRTLERRLRQFRTDYIDVFLFLGVTDEAQFPKRTREELQRLKEDGKVRAVGMSCHDRRFIGRLAAGGELDVFMTRYNAAHRGAERDVFPHLARHNPGIVAYTATRWTMLLRRTKGWPASRPIPTAGQCYRFVLSNPNVHVCMTAPTNEKQLVENLAALGQGPLPPDEMAFMLEYGDAVYNRRQWFM